MSITTISYDPKTTATQLATESVSQPQKLLDADVKNTGILKQSLSTLRSALSAFQDAATTFTSAQSALVTTATFSSEVATATASATAQQGTYSFFVEQLAKANQVSYSGLTDTSAANPGTLVVRIADGTSFDVDLSTADADGNGSLSPKEIGIAINHAAGNNGKLSASVATFNGNSNLILTSGSTGAANAATLDTSSLSASSLQTQLSNPVNKKIFVPGQDAIIWLGNQGAGEKIQQASNTFSIIDGVKMTMTKPQITGSDPVTLTIGADATATTTKLNGFLDSYNKLVSALKTVMDHGDFANNVAPGAFSNDSGVIALKSKIDAILRSTVAGKSLATYGVTAQRDGTLTLDAGRFAKAFAADPYMLDKVVGGTDAGGTGVMGALNKALTGWTGTSGQLSTREASELVHEKRLQDRQDKITDDYNTAYKRFNAQYTLLQQVQAQMTQNSALFDNLFGGSNH